MKKSIFILSLFLAVSHTTIAQDYCDTLQWKVVNSKYYEYLTGNSGASGYLDNAVINLDTLSGIYTGFKIVNVSKDTLLEHEEFGFISYCHAYTSSGATYTYAPCGGVIDEQINPNDTLSFYITNPNKFNFLAMIDHLENNGVDFDQILHWKMINTCSYNSRSGHYSDSVVLLGADTSIFYLVKTPVNIQERENELTDISIFPNPAQSQFTITNTENAVVCLYNLLGQKVKQVTSTEENTIIQTEDLSAGMYVLKVEKGNAIVTKKVQVTK